MSLRGLDEWITGNYGDDDPRWDGPEEPEDDHACTFCQDEGCDQCEFEEGT